MRRLLLAAAVLFAAVQPALAAGLSVPLDQSRRVSLSRPVADIAVGNPAIADVTVIDERNLLVTGKGQGVTNLLALDRAGITIFESEVVVSAGEGGRVSVFRGPVVQEYACGTLCQPAAPAAKQNP